MSRFLLPLALLLAVSHCFKIEADDKPAATTQKPEEKITYSLPKGIIPVHYAITLTPTLHGAFGFTGKSVITVKAINTTRVITMHSKDLDFEKDKVVVTVGNKTFKAELKVDDEKDEEKKTDFLTLTTTEDIEAGKDVIITLEYSGVLNDDLRGFYRSSYINEKKEKRWLATTHFEPTSARRAFPCFDEPALKATFEITIDLKEIKNPENKYKAISNMPLDGLKPTGTVYKFAKTPPMSTYLVAFVVSDFPEKSAGDNARKYTVYTKPDLINDAEYPLRTGKELLEALEKYTGVKYQLPKMDQIGIPDFSAGAMENWGLVTYRQHSLAVNEKKATSLKLQSVAGIIAHEFAHQWFGNHVGPEWWTYLWLNEGFAAFFQSYITDEVEKTFQMRDQFVVKNLQGSAFVFDVTEKSRAMNSKVESPKEISGIFDTISYDKSACVIRMMKDFLTEDIFKKGLMKYLNDNQNKDANSDKLFKSLNEIWKNDKQDLTKIMNTWVNTAGYPVITVTRNYEKKSAEVKQQRFLKKQPKDKGEEKWTIPINFASEAKPEDDFKATNSPHWFESDKEKLDLDLKVEGKHWVIFNKQQSGYYRVNYDEHNWDLISKYLSKNETTLNKVHKLNRAQLLDDAWNLAEAGLLKYEIAYKLTGYLELETDYFPWYAGIRNLLILHKRLLHTQHYEDFKKFGLRISEKLLKDVGTSEQTTDDHIKKLKRGLALEWVCVLEHETCKTFEGLFKTWIENSDISKIAPNLRSRVFCEGLKNANETVWNEVYKRYEKSQDPAEKDTFLYSLGCSKNEKILYNYFKLAMKDNDKYNDFNNAIQSVINNRNDIGMNVSLDFIAHNVAGILKIDKGDHKNLLSYLKNIGKEVTREEEFHFLESFAKEDESLDKKELTAATDAAKENIEWVKNYGNSVGQLFIKKNSATSLKFATIFCLIPIFVSLFM